MIYLFSIKLLYYSNISGAYIFLNLGVTLKTDLFILLATYVDVECIFSEGCILLSHLQSRLSVQSTQALMCLEEWSHLGYLKDEDIKEVVAQPEVPANKREDQLAKEWDHIGI